ncbi:MAG: sulfotransferase [Deinococcales bacterium]
MFQPQGFVDKTPGIAMLRMIPDILLIWPQAKIIFAKRRGIENIDSRLRKFPHVSFEEHCRQWQETMMYWYSLREKLDQGQYVEIDQHDIEYVPEKATQQLADFLHLSPEQKGQMLQRFQEKHPEKTRQAYRMEIKSLDEMAWSKDEKLYFKKICSEAMDKFGYSYDSSYDQHASA